ncbi:hypothetical protein SUGI_0918060 [Cryptomeria japonica]|nr:hypothetical protein SUGI_0918060 [Cryptomeria japonica]
MQIEAAQFIENEVSFENISGVEFRDGAQPWRKVSGERIPGDVKYWEEGKLADIFREVSGQIVVGEEMLNRSRLIKFPKEDGRGPFHESRRWEGWEVSSIIPALKLSSARRSSPQHSEDPPLRAITDTTSNALNNFNLFSLQFGL